MDSRLIDIKLQEMTELDVLTHLTEQIRNLTGLQLEVERKLLETGCTERYYFLSAVCLPDKYRFLLPELPLIASEMRGYLQGILAGIRITQL